jgi:zinc transporter 2
MVSRAANESHTFGYHRAEVLGALLSVVIIWAMTGGLFYASILRSIAWFNGSAEPVNGKLMFIIATLGLFVNLALMAILVLQAFGCS